MMRKYLFVIVAVFSAFTLYAMNSHHLFSEKNENLDTFYWYRVTYDGLDPFIASPTDIEFSGVPETVAYADSHDGCMGTGRDCLRGFSSQLSTNPADYPITQAGSQKTTKNP